MTQNNCDKPHLSYSQINTYLTCPLKYRFHYLDQLAPAFTSVPLAFGSAIHEAVGAFYQSQLEGDPLSVDNMFDVYRQIWLSQSQEKEIRFFNGDTPETLPVKARRMLEVFYEAFDPRTQIVGIEEFFEIDMGKRMPPLVGWIDAVEQAPDGAISIVDLKTAAKRYSDQTVQANLQLTCYSLGAQALGFDGDLRLRLDVLLKTKEPDLVRYETTRTDADRERFVRLVKGVWQGIKKEVFFPNEDWQCGQCPYADPCKQW
jgi:putative RecB family exonuclease